MFFKKSIMKKIAFFLNNQNISNIDYKNIQKGNPGIGGSEYLCVLVTLELTKRKNYDIYLLSEEKVKGLPEINNIKCRNIENALEIYSNKMDLFVIDSKHFDFNLAKKFPKAKFILWINNTMKGNTMKMCLNYPNIVKLVHVSREMYDLYRDTLVFPKTTYIFNAVPLNKADIYRNIIPNSMRRNNVVYVGSIVPNKGFHILAQAWRSILTKVPDAELYVIGSGRLYSENQQLGEYGIAEESYEKQFMPYLIDENNKIIKSVHFMGIMGAEKNELFSTCRVGVPNPSGKSETFGYTAVEMASMGCRITTKYCPGYIDTVYNTKNLYKQDSDLSTYIINLLLDRSDQSIEYKKTLMYFSENFSIEKVVNQWEELLADPSKEILYEKSDRSNYQLKNIKEIIRKYCPNIIKRYIPSIEHIYRSSFARKYLKTECPYIG